MYPLNGTQINADFADLRRKFKNQRKSVESASSAFYFLADYLEVQM
jgi:hypothetical protein